MSAATTVSDALVVAKRNLIKIKRVPDLLVFTTMSPIMFILLFAYVFGGAIDQQGGGAAYREFLIAGIFAQTVVFGATITGYGLAEDVKKGIIDRFRSLPMSPSAVLAGRTFSDVVNNVITLFVMSLTGLLVGWRIREGVLQALWAYILLLVFAYAISWIMAWIGMLVPSPEVVNNAVVHGDLPADVRRQHVRAAGDASRAAPDLRRVEPGLGGDRGRAGPVRQLRPDRGARADGVAAAEPRALHDHLVGRHPADLHPVGQRAVPQGDQPLMPLTPTGFAQGPGLIGWAS